jgi:hypothetical protein
VTGEGGCTGGGEEAAAAADSRALVAMDIGGLEGFVVDFLATVRGSMLNWTGGREVLSIAVANLLLGVVRSADGSVGIFWLAFWLTILLGMVGGILSWTPFVLLLPDACVGPDCSRNALGPLGGALPVIVRSNLWSRHLSFLLFDSHHHPILSIIFFSHSLSILNCYNLDSMAAFTSSTSTFLMFMTRRSRCSKSLNSSGNTSLSKFNSPADPSAFVTASENFAGWAVDSTT